MTYTKTAMSLHWLMAILLFGLLALGFYMHDLPLSPQKLQFYSWHKWAGVTAFLLVLVRLAWRATHVPPALPASMPKLMQFAAHAGHFMLYALMLAIPLTGWLMSSAKGFQTVYLGIIPLPDLLAKDKEIGDTLATVHQVLNFTMAALVITHVAAALKHYVVDRDEVLGRMIPLLDRKK